MSESLDLSGAFEKIQDMLSTSDGQEQIQGILSAFMSGDGESENSSDLSCSENSDRNTQNNISNLLSGFSSGGSGSSGITPEMLFKIQRIMSLMNNAKPEVSVEFLRCLKPLLKKSRREKVDKAVKMITLIKTMEILRMEGGL